MTFYRKSHHKKHFPKKSSVKKAVKKVKKANFDKAIRQVVTRMAEKKEINVLSTLLPLGNYVNTTTFQPNNVSCLTPSASDSYGGPFYTISQGTGQANRIGNDITVVSAKLRMMFFPFQYDATVNSVPKPQILNIWIVKFKDCDRSTAVTAKTSILVNGVTNFLQSGNSDSALTGNMTDYLLQPNTDILHVYKKMTLKLGSQIYTDPGSVAPQQYANNDFKINQIHSVDLMHHGFPKKISFNDTTTEPTNINPLWLIISPVNADGTANANTTASTPVNFQWMVDIRFTDM